MLRIAICKTAGVHEGDLPDGSERANAR